MKSSTFWLWFLSVFLVVSGTMKSSVALNLDENISNLSQVTPKNESEKQIEIAARLQVNKLPPVLSSHLMRTNESLTIFELLMLSQLESVIKDMMGIGSFQDPFWTSTGFLMNLLDASQWSIKKATRNFRRAIDMRIKNMVALHEIPEQNLENYFPVEMNGYDQEGCKVLHIPIGEWRTYRSYLEKIKSLQETSKNLKLYLSNVLESLFNHVRTRNCSQVVLIADLKGYSKNHNSGLRFFIDSIKDFAKSYPGMLKMAYVINSTPEFLKVADAYRSNIPWELRRRTFIFTQRAFWEYPLNQLIDPSQLPQKLGGTNIFL